MTRPVLAVGLATLLALACKKDPPAPAADGAREDAASASAGVAGPPTGVPAYVGSVTILRREPSEAPRTPGPKGKPVPNFLATLQRGEKVTPVELRDEWARVRTSDDHEGWLKRAALVEGEGLTEATLLVPADVFDRPDLLAANARRKLEPGTLLLVVKARPPFSEVNVSGTQNAWVLTDRLATGERDVSVAKLVEKARWLKRNGKPDEAKAILALARSTFGDGPLVEVLATELGEGVAADGGEVQPASGELPTPPPGEGPPSMQ